MKAGSFVFTLGVLFLAGLFTGLNAQQTYISVGGEARKIELTSGNTKFLKDVNKINVSYDYSDMAVGGFKTETRYLQSVIDEKGDEEGQAFVRKWQSWPQSLFEPRFLMVFMKKIGDYPTASNYSKDGDINLLVKVLNEYPDPNGGRRYILVDCIFSDRKDQRLAVFRLYVNGSHEFSMSEGLAECYGFAGGMLAKELKRLIKIAKDRAANGY